MQVISGERRKTGVIFHGDPGNGKSYFVRYLALKYKLPVYIVSFIPKMTNHSLIRMFSRVRGPGIVLFEDFDSYFEGRKCLMKDAEFTFDSILNVLDGMYSNPKGIIFFLTANDVRKLDPSIRERPSRFQFVRHIGPPSHEMIMRIFNDTDHEELIGRSLDEILSLRDRNVGTS